MSRLDGVSSALSTTGAWLTLLEMELCGKSVKKNKNLSLGKPVSDQFYFSYSDCADFSVGVAGFEFSEKR